MRSIGCTPDGRSWTRSEARRQVKAVTPPDGSMRPDFERVLALDFDNLISAHGTPKLGGAREALARSVERLPR